jgi:deoxyribose-phosphate aldolase
MDFNIEEKFSISVDEAVVNKAIQEIQESVSKRIADVELMKACLSHIDLTTLNATDGLERAEQFTANVNGFAEVYPSIGNVAAICVYPSLVSSVRENLTAEGVKIASVAAGFPASQTFLDIKLSECEMCIENGADELDIVISLGRFLEGDLFTVFSEIQQIKEVCGDTRLKVILETGAIPTLSQVRLASLLAMEAGADFIKTSTGKLEPAATPEAVYTMCLAIKNYHEATGRMVGIKPAGGMSTSGDVALYFLIVEKVLGKNWLTPQWLRFGASRLADNLLSDIRGEKTVYFSGSGGTSKY